MSGFWRQLPLPIVGLSPMDGITDAPFRYITAKYGHPDVMFTEFTAVEGIAAGADRLLKDFFYDPIERPIVAQLFGSDPRAFYRATFAVCALGFDGVDINLGCPSKTILRQGAGGSLIGEYAQVREIISQVKKAVSHWAEGKLLWQSGLPENLLTKLPQNIRRVPISVSVKTRIGQRSNQIEEWMPFLASLGLDAITLHGRTLAQMYSGRASWDDIARAAEIVHSQSPGTIFLGNGDVETRAEAKLIREKYGVDGVLIGRAAIGNPWLFSDHVPDWQQRCAVIKEHCQVYADQFPLSTFPAMRKHLVSYLKGFEGAKQLRLELSKATDPQTVVEIIEQVSPPSFL
jgi:nifR3 family TIM-barrel protein